LQTKAHYAEAHYNWANALTQSGRNEEAIEQYRHALRIRPDLPQAHHNLGIALVREGRLPEAVEEYREAVRVKPDHLEARNNLGNLLISLGRPGEAIEQYEHILRLNPNHAEAHFNLSLALIQVGKVPEAIVHAKEAARLLPQHSQVIQMTAALLANCESSDKEDQTLAVELAQRACALTHRQDIACLDTLGIAYAAAGRFDEAAAAAKEAWQLAQTAGKTAQAEAIHMRWQLYRDRKPFRELKSK
jgi:tetratricopeptide (TPR) repeat protein